jgi:peptidoglycan hydrolase-like protein with peptidoglycan-binding domain
MRPQNRPRTALRTLFATTCAAAVAVTTAIAGTAAWQSHDGEISLVASSNPKTPGNFTGYGFDQCLTPTQAKMDAWLTSSPFLGVGVYISGNSRACRSQPNLTASWVSTQLSKGWRILPITLGPQASCQPRFPRYNDDPTINPSSTDDYAAARGQGRLEAGRAVAAANALGIVPGSTLFYDLEGFDLSNTACRASALRFVDAWTVRLHELGFVSGFYSSASSGIKMVDDVRVNYPGRFTLPDHLWIARWDGEANTSTESQYLRSDGWMPHRRVKQYQGGHNETWGGVTINIDRNWLDVGRGSYAPAENHCDGTNVNLAAYPSLTLRTSQPEVIVLKCLLREQGYAVGRLNTYYGKYLHYAVQKWQADHAFTPTTTWSRPHWASLHAQGTDPVLKRGSAGTAVRRLQRALIANGATLTVTGTFDAPTDAALRHWQAGRNLQQSGVATAGVWSYLRRGR